MPQAVRSIHHFHKKVKCFFKHHFRILSVAALLIFTYLRYGKSVAPLVVRMPCVTLYPDKTHAVTLKLYCQPLPQIRVLHLVRLSTAISAASPRRQPALGHSVHKVFAVRRQTHHARLVQRLQRRYSAHQLHPVVGREPFSA